MPSPTTSPADKMPAVDAKPALAKASDSNVRENLGIRAYQLLKNDIIKGFFSPGEKLRMHALKAHYDLGISPLREALSQLVAEHLVVAISQRGYRVAPMSLAELHDIYDARAQLEAMLLGLAIERGDDAWESEVVAKAHHLNMISASNTSDELLNTWDERHSTFHTTLVSGCNSSSSHANSSTQIGA